MLILEFALSKGVTSVNWLSGHTNTMSDDSFFSNIVFNSWMSEEWTIASCRLCLGSFSFPKTTILKSLGDKS
jgi:hypothetical protein